MDLSRFVSLTCTIFGSKLTALISSLFIGSCNSFATSLIIFYFSNLFGCVGASCRVAELFIYFLIIPSLLLLRKRKMFPNHYEVQVVGVRVLVIDTQPFFLNLGNIITLCFLIEKKHFIINSLIFPYIN
jgi:hypothetical protein